MAAQQRITLQPGFVLHSRAYRDTSMLLELFTLEHGRVGAVARGVRKEKSRWASLLQPFRSLLFSWSGRGELYTLTGVEEGDALDSLTGSTAICGFYMNELLMRLLQRHDAHGALYAAYRETLQRLTQGHAHAAQQPEGVLRLFEKRLLDELGYGLILDHTADGGEALHADAIYSYEIERGPLARHDRSNGIAVHGSTLMCLARGDMADAQTLRESKHLMRAALAHHLGDKPLHSRGLFQHVASGAGINTDSSNYGGNG